MSLNLQKESHQQLLETAQQGQVTVSHIYKIKIHELKKMFETSGRPLDELKDHGSTQSVIKKLGSNESTGIIGDEKDLKRRIDVFGQNIKPLPILNGLIESIKQVVREDRIWAVVAVTAVISGLCGAITVQGWGGLVQGFSIIIAMVFLIFVTSLADYVKDRRFVELQELIKEETIAVIRGREGATQTVSVWDLVVGDVILIDTGARIPADCLVITSSELHVQEQGFQDNGENFKLKCAVQPDDGEGSQKDPFLFADSLVQKGKCKAIVCAVGENSTRGCQDKKLDTAIDTPLQDKLQNLSDLFTHYALCAAIFILVIFLIMMAIQIAQIEEGSKITPAMIMVKRIPEAVSLVVVLIVVVIPEGLPLTIGISLAFTVMRMYHKNHILVRKLDAPEKMGGIEEIICSKTGTITTANMKVSQFYCEEKSVKNTRKNTLLHCELSDYAIEKIKEGILYNCEARVEMGTVTWVPVGNPTDVGLLKFLQDADIPVHTLIQRKYGRERAVSPFSSEKKRSAIALDSPDRPGRVVIHLKGAPETILEMCKTKMVQRQEIELGHDDKNQIEKQVKHMAENRLRVLALACCEMDRDEWNRYEERGGGDGTNMEFEDALQNGELGFSFLCVIGLKDPIRPGVRKQVEFARNDAKIQVRLVSGDHIDTAKKYAIESGILSHEELRKQFAVMDAEDFRRTVGQISENYEIDGQKVQATVEREDAFREVQQNLRVLARANAQDKYLLVVGLRALGKNVTVTGDGINDVLALQAANVGLAMGSGCSAAKEKADLILTDNDFSAVIMAISWGRNIFHNVSRFLQFQLTVNLSCVATIAIGLVIFYQSPLNPVQLLWINLIMDTFAALALSTEPPLKSVIKGEPIKQEHNKKASVLSPTVLRQIFGISAWIVLVMFCIMVFGQSIASLDYDRSVMSGFRVTVDKTDSGYDKELKMEQDSIQKEKHFTYIFNVFVFLQLFNEINCRKVGIEDYHVFENFTHNWYFISVVGFTFIAQVCLSEYLSSIVGTMKMKRSEWGACIAVGSTPLLVSLLLKLFIKGDQVEKLGNMGINEDNKTNSMVLNMYKKNNKNPAKENFDQTASPEVEAGGDNEEGGAYMRVN